MSNIKYGTIEGTTEHKWICPVKRCHIGLLPDTLHLRFRWSNRNPSKNSGDSPKMGRPPIILSDSYYFACWLPPQKWYIVGLFWQALVMECFVSVPPRFNTKLSPKTEFWSVRPQFGMIPNQDPFSVVCRFNSSYCIFLSFFISHVAILVRWYEIVTLWNNAKATERLEDRPVVSQSTDDCLTSKVTSLLITVHRNRSGICLSWSSVYGRFSKDLDRLQT